MRTHTFIVVATMLGITLVWLFVAERHELRRPQAPSCAPEVRTCPDGSTVTRQSPECNFAPCSNIKPETPPTTETPSLPPTPPSTTLPPSDFPPSGSGVACTMDARICPDGSAVGRVPPACEFSPCPATQQSQEVVVQTPVVNATITSPVTVEGVASGSWFFEGSFPVTIVDARGMTIGSGIANARSNTPASTPISFTASIPFEGPGPHVTDRSGKIILRKDNPSGLPQNASYFEVPVVFQ